MNPTRWTRDKLKTHIDISDSIVYGSGVIKRVLVSDFAKLFKSVIESSPKEKYEALKNEDAERSLGFSLALDEWHKEGLI